MYSSKDDLDEEDVQTEKDNVNPQLRKEEEELSKIATGIGKVFLKTVKEREKIMAYRKANLDPRNASRTPSAKTEIAAKLRYDNPVNACKEFILSICVVFKHITFIFPIAPSRDMDRPKPWEEDEYIFYRNSHLTRSQPYINYNG